VVKKSKPIMGTKLVQSIENLEGCFEWGGKWDAKDEVCIKEDESGGCTAPYRGVEFCWDVVDFEDHIENFSGRMTRVELHKPEAWGSIVHGNEFWSTDDGSDSSYYNDFDSRTEAMDVAKEWALEKRWETCSGPCYNPRGKQIDCDKPNAVACPDPASVVGSFKNYFRENKSLTGEVYPWLTYKYRKEPLMNNKYTDQIKID